MANLVFGGEADGFTDGRLEQAVNDFGRVVVGAEMGDIGLRAGAYGESQCASGLLNDEFGGLGRCVMIRKLEGSVHCHDGYALVSTSGEQFVDLDAVVIVETGRNG